MTRLRDALEKAARSRGTSRDVVPGSLPVHVVPDAWHLDEPARPGTSAAPTLDVADVPPIEALFPAEADGEQEVGSTAPTIDNEPEPIVSPRVPSVATPDVVVAPREGSPLATTIAAQATETPLRAVGRGRRKDPDLWASYPFGERAVGKLVVGPNANPGLIEQYRRLGAAMHHHQLQTGTRTLMVTSAAASEGKTLTSMNLALTLSHSYQRRVLLIDADLRRPSVHHLLRLENTVGLSDCVRRHDLVARYQAVTPTLSVLTAGRPESDPMAGLVSDTMRSLLTAAASEFDWVIVDTPPVALLPDANLLAAMIDSALIVIGASATPYPLVRRAVEAIGESRVLGVVLNRMAEADIVRAYNYYGYGQYAYGVMKRRGRRLMFWKRQHQEPVSMPARDPGV